jgi:hypothetical protein
MYLFITVYLWPYLASLSAFAGACLAEACQDYASVIAGREGGQQLPLGVERNRRQLHIALSQYRHTADGLENTHTQVTHRECGKSFYYIQCKMTQQYAIIMFCWASSSLQKSATAKLKCQDCHCHYSLFPILLSLPLICLERKKAPEERFFTFSLSYH